MKISFFGGAREVGRSCYLLDTGSEKIMMDCGVKLSREEKYPEIGDNFPDLLLLTHAHLDHSGYIPVLSKQSQCKIFSTKPTYDLCQLLLSDYLKISSEKKRQIFSQADLSRALRRFQFLRFRERIRAGSAGVRFYSSGHILGSAIIQAESKGKRILYTGDLNFRDTRLLYKADSDVEQPDVLIIECTYGSKKDQLPSLHENAKRFAKLVKKTATRGGTVLVPAFAVGRGQEIMLTLESYLRSKAVPELPIVIDGMVRKANRIHRQNVVYLREELPRRILVSEDDPFKSKYFYYPKSKDRKDVFEMGSCVIISSSGMLSGGPSVYYLKKLVEDPRNSIALVGYQVEGTLGRELLDGAERVRVGEEELEVNAEIQSFHFSAHADYSQLVSFVESIPLPKQVFVVHGEEKKCGEFAEAVSDKFDVPATAPRIGESFEI